MTLLVTHLVAEFLVIGLDISTTEHSPGSKCGTYPAPMTGRERTNYPSRHQGAPCCDPWRLGSQWNPQECPRGSGRQINKG